MYRIILSLLLVMVFMAPQAVMAAASSELANVRWSVHKDAIEGTSKLRLVIDTTGPVIVKGSLNAKTSPNLTIDVKGATIGSIDSSVALKGEIAEKVSFVKKNASSSQIIVALPRMIEETDYKVFTLPSDIANNKSFRIVIDINKPVPKASYNFTAGLKDKVIVIDPGHGGSDSGAIGPGQTQEKTITLAIGQQVQNLLERAGAKVVMTRQTDVDVYGPNASGAEELGARTKIATNNKADVFVSIHIDAFSNPSVGGITTYYYQKSGYDAMLAQNIQDNLMSSGIMQDRGIKVAGFYVIKRSEMPAVLAELGFISNPEEEKLLNTPKFQQQMAQGIVQGLESFFAQAARRGGGS